MALPASEETGFGAVFLHGFLSSVHGGISLFCSRRPRKIYPTAPLEVVKFPGSKTHSLGTPGMLHARTLGFAPVCAHGASSGQFEVYYVVRAVPHELGVIVTCSASQDAAGHRQALPWRTHMGLSSLSPWSQVHLQCSLHRKQDHSCTRHDRTMCSLTVVATCKCDRRLPILWLRSETGMNQRCPRHIRGPQYDRYLRTS